MGQDGRHRQLQQLAHRQWSVLRVEQIYAIGFTDREIQGLLRRLILHRRYKAIYTYATDRPEPRGVLLAAQWSCGEDAYLTGRTALALGKVRALYLRRIEIAVPRRTVRARRPPIELQRVSVAPNRVREDGPLRFATVPQALLDMAARGAWATELRRLITDAIHGQRLDHGEMRAFLETQAGRPGISTLKQAYAKYLPRAKAKSGLERAFDAGLNTRPHIPEPERNTYIRAAGIDWEADRYWPEQGVLAELHGGGYHDAAEDREKDDFKAAKLALIGIQTMAISEDRWKLEPEACLDDLEGLLTLRGWRRAGD